MNGKRRGKKRGRRGRVAKICILRSFYLCIAFLFQLFLYYILRLHRVHEMQPVVISDTVAWVSVSLSVMQVPQSDCYHMFVTVVTFQHLCASVGLVQFCVS